MGTSEVTTGPDAAPGTEANLGVPREESAMKVTILCESMFGNTEHLAETVRSGLEAAGATARVVEVAEARTADFADVDLLLVAAPTHALSLSRPESRADAVERGADPARALVGIREWIGDVDVYFPPAVARPPVAVFDTRVLKTRHWPGSAAGRAARGLRRAGFEVLERMNFFVEGITGPLADGESVRAYEWAKQLVGEAARHRRADGVA